MQRLITSIQENTVKDSDACRIFHGRGHCYSGLEFITIDWYSPVLLISLYKEPDPEWLQSFIQKLAVFNDHKAINNILLQYRYLPNAPSENIKGELSGDYYAHEKNLKFCLNFTSNQNVGFFLDMKNCRESLRKKAHGKSILNLFSYTCAFSVVAAQAGARKIVNIDMAKGALNTGRNNHKINSNINNKSNDKNDNKTNAIDMRSVSFLSHDIFKSWGKIKKQGPYDIIIADPPSYQAGSFDIKKDYSKIVKRLPDLLTQSGLVFACVNSPDLGFDFLRHLFLREQLFTESEIIAPPTSFPDTDINRGLKTLIFKKSTLNLPVS